MMMPGNIRSLAIILVATSVVLMTGNGYLDRV